MGYLPTCHSYGEVVTEVVGYLPICHSYGEVVTEMVRFLPTYHSYGEIRTLLHFVEFGEDGEFFREGVKFYGKFFGFIVLFIDVVILV